MLVSFQSFDLRDSSRSIGLAERRCEEGGAVTRPPRALLYFAFEPCASA
jgi:hypothetical protein